MKSTHATWIMIVLGMLMMLGVIGVIILIITRPQEKPQTSVCMSRREYDALVAKSQPQLVMVPQKENGTTSRDMQVVVNPLYPPLNRSETPTHNSLKNEVEARNMYVPTTRDNLDRFRLVGYLTSKEATSVDSGGNNWKLFARQRDRHSAEFYIIPANNNYDIKIMLTDDIVKGTRLRDTYTIPNEISFNTPLLNKTPYEFVEIPKTDFTTTPPVYL